MKTILLLTLSNVFMTFAWYAHLKDLRDKIVGSEERYRDVAPSTRGERSFGNGRR